ncbi:MAG: hypothetical protein QOI73_1820 [Solirubrobacteraceae bacterium]|nr:hypothetical protein [Solirubrobacteraceae bacterium]
MGVATLAAPRVRGAGTLAAADGAWLRSPRWDLTFLIGSAALVPIPLLLHHVLGLSQTGVNLLVAGLIGGPHLYSTFTYTFMEPSYRRRHRRFLAASMALPAIVTAMSFLSLQILLTVFFLWASIHVLHQITYINDCYVAKAPAVRPRRERIVDYGVVFLCLYPVAMPQILDGSFQLGGTRLWVPGWATHGIVATAQVAGVATLFGAFFVLWVAKTIRDWRRGTLLVPSVLLVALTILVGFTLPLMPNVDVAFQGFNVWHSVQYLGLVWYLMAMRKQRGELCNRFVAQCNGPDRPWKFYALAVGLTAAAGMLVLVLHVMLGVGLQQSYYIVILSTLLQHYYLDHLQFTKLGDMLGSGERLLVGRAGAA